MRTRNSIVGLPMLIVLIIALVTLFLIGVVGAQAATVFNQMTIHDQNIDATSIVLVDSVTASQSGWVVIYKSPDFTADNEVGHAAVHEGTNLGVKVNVSLPLINHRPMLWAVLQSDQGTPGVFEWGNEDRAYADAPIAQNGQVVMAQFATTVAPLPAFLTTVSGGAAPSKTPPDSIKISDQNLDSGIILLDSVTTDQNGWVVIYKNPNLTPGEIVGFAPVYIGTNTHVKVTIDTSKINASKINTSKMAQAPVLWAQLHSDGGIQGVFEWGTQGQPFSDWPVVQNDQYIRASFSTAAPSQTMSTTAAATDRITVHDQDLSRGIITVDSVTTDQNGWVVIYKDPNLTSGGIVGYAPVYQGTNQGVEVTIDTTKVGDQPILWAVLHADGGLRNIFEWGYQGRQFSDPPVFRNGNYVSTGFATSGP